MRAWATTAEVDPDFAAQKWSELCERHGWHQNGTLLDWRARFSRIWKSDGPQWEASQKKRGAAAGGLTLPANALPTDPTWWWTDPIESLGAVQAGAALAGDQKNAARLGEVIAARRKGA